MSDEGQQRPLAGDRPIESADQDTIGRAGFAQQIRQEIEAASRDEGLVLAITGEWGSGKTSVINLALRPLEDRAGFQVVRFNPWLFSGTDELIKHFFTELRTQLHAAENAQLKAVGVAVEHYSNRIASLRFIPAVSKTSAFGQLLGKGLKGPDVSVTQQREKINLLLEDQDDLLVIVMDDIDRLRDDEVADVMRLVRLVADFPNTVYVLAFDVDRVAKAISGDDPQDGHDYIEKIVQVAHEVPSISGEQLSKLLLQRISEVLDGISYRLDRQHWSALYLAFQKYLKTPRDVSRFCNHFRGPMVLLSKEVDAADILALEALRLFDRSLWSELPGLITELTDSSSPTDPFKQRPDDAGDRLKEIIDKAILPATAREVLQELFPAAGRHLGGSNYGSGYHSTWRRALRVAHPAVFQVYLSKQIQPTDVSTELVERALGLLSDAEAFRREIHRLDATQLADLLTRLEDYEGKFPVEVAPAIPVLYELIPRLPPREGMLSIEPDMRVTRVVLRLLANRESATVTEIVAQTIKHLPSLSDHWSLVRLVGHLEGSGHRLVSESEAELLEEQLVTAILNESAQQLAAERDLARLISLAIDRKPTEGRAKVVLDVEDDGFLLTLIAGYCGEVRSDMGRHLRLGWDHLADLVGEDLLIKRVTELPDPAGDTDADTLEMLAQARRHAAEPEKAAQELAEYRRHYPG
jgi:predicted KAP-like P-loop ATPase